jgi:hypothetical protein
MQRLEEGIYVTHPTLEPPDLARCQGEWTTYNAWVMGGNVYQRTRCPKPPTVIITETEPGPDGQRGSMSLCDSCLAVFLEKDNRAVDIQQVEAV